MSKLRYPIPSHSPTNPGLGSRLLRAHFGGNQNVSITGLGSAAAFGTITTLGGDGTPTINPSILGGTFHPP